MHSQQRAGTEKRRGRRTRGLGFAVGDLFHPDHRQACQHRALRMRQPFLLRLRVDARGACGARRPSSGSGRFKPADRRAFPGPRRYSRIAAGPARCRADADTSRSRRTSGHRRSGRSPPSSSGQQRQGQWQRTAALRLEMAGIQRVGRLHPVDADGARCCPRAMHHHCSTPRA